MVARSRHTGPLADRLTRPMLRIRQPATEGPVLNGLERDAGTPLPVHSNPADNATDLTLRFGRISERRRVTTQAVPTRMADCGPAARVLGSNFFFHGRNAIFTRHAESNGLATSAQIRSSPIVATDLAREPMPRTRAKRRHRAPAISRKETVQACLEERRRNPR